MPTPSFLNNPFLSLVATAALLASFASSSTQADEMFIWAEENGGNTTLYFQGSIDKSGYVATRTTLLGLNMSPMNGFFLCGRESPLSPPPVEEFMTLPPGDAEKSFGTGGSTVATSSAGDAFGFNDGFLYLPSGYISGTQLSGSMFFQGETIASLGIDLTPRSFNTTVGTNTILLMVNPNEARVDNAAAIAKLRKKIRKLQKRVRTLKKRGRATQARKLNKKIKKLRRELVGLS